MGLFHPKQGFATWFETLINDTLWTKMKSEGCISPKSGFCYMIWNSTKWYIMNKDEKRSTDFVMIVYRQKMLFILPLAQPQTTCRRFLLAWTVIYMKRSLCQGEKVVFWTLSPPRKWSLQVCLLVCRTWWPTFIWCTLCMDVVSVGEQL